MKKYFISSLFLFILFGMLYVSEALAGGCCYRSFSATNGIVGQSEAKIQAVFIQPKPPFDGLLVNEKMTIHILNAKAGQSCKTLTDSTDSNGLIEATCFSTVPGDMQIYFSAPNLDAESNQNIGYVPQKVSFSGDVTVQTTTEVATTTSETEVTTTVEVTNETDNTAATNNAEALEMKEKIAKLEQKVEEQEKEVNSLKSILNKIMDYFSNLFN